jgi:hypothetical protein
MGRTSLPAPGRGLWLILALALLAPLLVAVLWGGVTADAAYLQFQRARAVAAGDAASVDRFSPLFTLTLALAARLHLPLLPVATVLSVLGWTVAVAASFGVGLALERPTLCAGGVLLALNPLQPQILGLETGLALGLLGMTAWWAVRGRIGVALVAAVVLVGVQPLAIALVLPLLACFTLRERLGATRPVAVAGILSLALGSVVIGLACALSDGWDVPRLTAPLLAALQLLVASGLAVLAPRLDRLARPALDTCTLRQVGAALVLLALAVWQGTVLARDWRVRPVDRLALYDNVALWLGEHALPSERIATQRPGLLGYASDRTTLPLDGTGEPGALLAAIQRAQPDYCVATSSLAWRYAQADRWFQERYVALQRFVSPYDVATPLTIFGYTPSLFDAGETVSTTARFTSAEGEIELVSYRLSSRRAVPGEPLHVTLTWRAATAIRQPLLLTLRLVEPATGHVWAQVEDTAPGGIETDLWEVGARTSDQYTLMVPVELPTGDYALDASFTLPSGNPLEATGGSAAGEGLAFAHVQYPPAVSAVPIEADHPLDLTFGGEIALTGYDVIERVAPGGELRVALYWRALRPIPLDYKVFVHLLAPGDSLIAQDDSEPVAWSYPTTDWQPGETIRDEHVLIIDPSVPRGDYLLFAGLYDPATGDRPPVRDAAGNALAERRVPLQQVQVR